MAQADQDQKGQDNTLSLEGRVFIDPDQPLPGLNAVGGAAYAAQSRRDGSLPLMGIICSRGLYPRADSVAPMKNVDTESVLRLIDAGVVSWPQQGAHYYTLIYERPRAEHFWSSLDQTHPVMSEDTLTQTFIKPMIKALAEFRRTGFVHGGIRPTNIFWQSASASPPQLGDGLSAPCGVGQPALFETIERAMCAPSARGLGVHEDDCYAFGVTLALVILGRNPFEGMDDAAILRAKIEKGTFGAMIGAKRLVPSQIEILRGLLNDDMRQRWRADELEQWLGGRRFTPKSTEGLRRASRHFPFSGKEYWNTRALAMAMAAQIEQAAAVIEDGSLITWLSRALGDEDRRKSLQNLLNTMREKGKGAHYADELVARSCILLDPTSPIRYRGVTVMPAGIASALIEAVTSDNANMKQILSEIIAAQLVTLWVNAQRDPPIDYVPMGQQFERLRSFIERTAFGGGPERILYELNPSLPCLSPILRAEYVVSPRYMLEALERVAAKGSTNSEPMDRHIAAFLVMREKRSESLFAAMGPGEVPLRRGLAILSLFGEMQYRYGPDSLPRLCGWLFPLVEACIKRFLSKPMQEKVRAQVQKDVEKGSLSAMLQHLDDPARIAKDTSDFMQAQQMYRDIKMEEATLEAGLRDRDKLAQEVGRPVAATLASLIALVLIAVTLGRGFFKMLGM
ncbi:MAG: serine/threonine protein kinase [Alphaproteobacteria bacterium]|nr:serine/threonine protein kinase [Alphaproteobacteria bacterium]